MDPQLRTERTPTTGLRFGKPIGVALLVAAGLFALALALSAPSPPGVAAHPCATETPETERHVDFRGNGVSCAASTHDDPHEHTIEVDGGRHRDLVFKAYFPNNFDDFNDADDSIVITFHRSFDLPNPLPALIAPGTTPPVGLITVDDSGEEEEVNVTSATVNGQKLTLTGGTHDGTSSTVEAGEHITITIKAGVGIETPETPQGFDNFENEEPYEVFITFVDGDQNPVAPKDAADRNFVIVKNPISSTVPNTSVRVELHTYAQAEISTTDDIVVDFSGPSADSGFILPSFISTSRIQVRYFDENDDTHKNFNPSEVLIQGERVIFPVPSERDDTRIAFSGDYTITFSNLARIKTPFSAGIKTIKVSSFVIGDEEDIIEAVVRRTTTLAPLAGPRGSEFELEGKGYAAGTVTIYHDADGDGNIDPGETLASEKTVRGAFNVDLTARGNPGEPIYRVTTRDSEGVEVNREFNIRSSMSFEPYPVSLGSNLKIIISDWEESRNEVVAVQIAGEEVFTAKAVEYTSCIEHPNAARRDSEGNVTITVVVPFDIPPGDQTVAVYDHHQLDYVNADNPAQPVIKDACHELPEGTSAGQLIGPLDQAIITDDPIAITKATVEIGSEQLDFSRSSAARGQRITITGSGFARSANGGNGIGRVLINGIEVNEDPSQFEVTTSGDFVFVVTVPIGVVDGGNEVRVEGEETSLAQGTLTVPASSIELDPPESRRGESVRVTGSNFIANRSVQLYYGDGGTDLAAGDTSIGSAFTDSAGGFEYTFNVPVGAEIGETHKVTGVVEAVDENGKDVTVRAEADHGPPGALITTSPEQVSAGDTLTISGMNMPQFAQVRPISISGIEVTPGPNPRTDRNGAFEARVIVPQVDPGDQLLRVEAAGVVVTHVINVIRPSVGRPPSEVFAALISAGMLGRVWKYDNSDQSWYLYDPDPEFAGINTLMKLDSGDILWVNVLAPGNFRGNELQEGWNLILVRFG